MKTTMKVESETRDLVKQVSRDRALDYDATIRLGMEVLQRETRRAQMLERSLELAADPDDLAEAARVMADMEAWDAR